MRKLNGIQRPRINLKANKIDISKFSSDELYQMSHSKLDIKLRITLLFEAALKGNLSALNDLGLMIAEQAECLNFKCNRQIGIDFLKSSAELGHAEAYLNLAYLNLNGIGLPQSIAKAFKCYEIADTLGHTKAMKMMEYVKKAIKDIPEAKQSEFIKLVTKDNTTPFAEIFMIEDEADRIYALAMCYYNGKFGLIKDVEVGVDMLYKAVEMKSSKAQHQLGLLYRSGAKGFELNIPGGTALVVMAAQNKDRPSARANYDVGMFYKNGNGVRKDLHMALKYFRRALAFGSLHAYEQMKLVNQELCRSDSYQLASNAYDEVKE
jgi:TPR repeat protein